MPALFRTDETGKVQPPFYLKSNETRIGSGSGNQVFIPTAIAPYTCVIIEETGGRWRLTDKSGYGVKLNNERWVFDATLVDGDRLEVGNEKLRFDSRATPETAPRVGKFISTTARLPEAGARPPGLIGQVTQEWKGGSVYNLGAGVVSIGSASSCDILVEAPFVSAVHCRIENRDGRYFIWDLGSMNGTTVGKAMLSKGAEVELIGEATIIVGKSTMTFRFVEPATQRPAPPGFMGMTGASPVMKTLFERIKLVAGAEGHVLVTGETGTGKELVAKAIHALSPRAGARYRAVNCASLTDTLCETILFGHEKGAFTGAQGSKYGAFEDAHGGTLFFDEVGELSPLVQATLLRALGENEVTRVGSNKPFKVDVRIVAATNRDLEGMIARGEFREDLFNRLNVFPIHLPPLKERGDDVLLIAEAFVVTWGMGKTLSADACRRLRQVDWNGNVRVLETAIQRAVRLNPWQEVIAYESLELRPATMAERMQEDEVYLPGLTMEQRELRIIRAAVDWHKGDKEAAAKELGIGFSTIKRKLREPGAEGEKD